MSAILNYIDYVIKYIKITISFFVYMALPENEPAIQTEDSLTEEKSEISEEEKEISVQESVEENETENLESLKEQAEEEDAYTAQAIREQLGLDSDPNEAEAMLRRYKEDYLLDFLFKAFDKQINKDSPLIRKLIRSLIVGQSAEDFKHIYHTYVEKHSSLSGEMTEQREGISDDDLERVYEEAHEELAYINENKDAVLQEQRAKEEQALDSQLDEEPSRTLEDLKEGVNIAVGSEHFEEFQSFVREMEEKYPDVPILELVKNQRIFDLSGYEDSKASLAVHDVYDHAIFSEILAQHGLLEKYEDLLEEIGDPLNTDALSRSGERLASIAYQARKMLAIDIDQYEARFSAKDKNIERLENLFAEEEGGRLEDASAILESEAYDEKRLEFVINEVLAEFMREKNDRGYLKYVAGDDQFEDFKFFDKRYLGLMVEIVHLLSQEEFQTEVADWEYKLCAYIEHILTESAEGAEPPQFEISFEEVQQFEPEDHLAPEKLEWLREHIGFTTLKNKMYEEEREVARTENDSE